MEYNINNFIEEEKLRGHVKKTLESYIKEFSSYDLKKFNKNIIDPIKLTFDMIIFKKSIEEIIEIEITRQLDKSLNNKIGYFHQDLFNYIIDSNWKSLKNSKNENHWDIENEAEHIFVEMKNKHNTMNSNSKSHVYNRMKKLIDENYDNKAYLVEVVSKKSGNNPWSVKTTDHLDARIRRMSIDKFMNQISKDVMTFYNFTKLMPQIVKEEFDKLTSQRFFKPKIVNSVYLELNKLSKQLKKDPLETLYYLAFGSYDGFEI